MTTQTEYPVVPQEQQLPGRRYTPEGIEVPAPSERDVLYEVRDGVAWITLNRPMILNAVDWSLTHHLGVALERAEKDPEALVVVLKGAGRAFCAGGDVRTLYDEGREGGPYPRVFYRDEYRLNRVIKTWPSAVWLNPTPERHWDYTPSIAAMRELTEDRMFPLTLKGLEQAMKKLVAG